MTEEQADQIIELLQFIAGKLNAITDDQERLEGLLEGSQSALREMSNKLDRQASSPYGMPASWPYRFEVIKLTSSLKDSNGPESRRMSLRTQAAPHAAG